MSENHPVTPDPADPAPSQAAPSDRLVVPDVLRGFALFGMLVAHAAPFLIDLPFVVQLVRSSLNDVASPLFALVMGLSAQILAQRTPGDRQLTLLVQQWIRGAVLLVLGVWLSSWGSWVAIVLSYLGLLLLIGAPLLLLSTRWLAIVAAFAFVVSAPLVAWAKAALWHVVAPDPALTELASWLVLGYHYRFVNLLPFFLLGALLMRHGFARDRWLWAMAIVAPIAYLVEPLLERVLELGPYASGSYPDTLHDVGLVFATYVVVVLLATVRAPGPARVIAIVFEPFRGVGAVALSLYLFHVALLAFWLQPGFTFIESDWLRFAVIVVGVFAIGWAWWRFVGVGPVEWLLGWVTGRPKRFLRVRANTTRA